jgi:hypothetical protein
VAKFGQLARMKKEKVASPVSLFGSAHCAGIIAVNSIFLTPSNAVQ